MSKYEKPIVLTNAEATEGIYMASGVATPPTCNSRYMQGNWRQPLYVGNGLGNDTDTVAQTNSVGDYYGCAGCPAYTDGGCGIPQGLGNASGNMPVWEAMGYTYEHFPAYNTIS